MNNPNPFVPLGSNLEQKNKARVRVRLAVFFILAINVVGLMALLMQGCRKPAEPEPEAAATNAPPPFEAPTNIVETNVASANVPTNAAPEMNPAMPGAGQEYTIVKGDTLSAIAKKFGVTWKMIEDANPGVQPTRLQPGKTLHIPPPAPPAATSAGTAATAPTGAAGSELTYKVQSGDTLTKIARQFGTSVKALRAENNLTTDNIKVGQVLKIPGKTSAPAPAAPPDSAPASNPAPAAPPLM